MTTYRHARDGEEDESVIAIAVKLTLIKCARRNAQGQMAIRSTWFAAEIKTRLHAVRAARV